MEEKNSNWAIPTESYELKNISLPNVTGRKFIRKIVELFDLVFEHHSDGDHRRITFQTCVEVCPQIMVELKRLSLDGGKLGIVSGDCSS